VQELTRGHRRRLRERFLRAMEHGLDDHELLELLLSYAIPRKDTKPLAKKLLTRHGSIPGALEAEATELTEQPGIGESAVVLLKLAHKLALKCMDPIDKPSDYLKSPEMVSVYFRTLLRGRREEQFHVALLDAKHRVLAVEELQQGTVDQAVVYPRRVAEAALRHKAKGVIAVHNHPSGDSTPSEEDIQLTRNLKTTLAAVDVLLLDHLIIGTSAYFSLREAGLL
jgi:DNA repair protein RadC